MRSEKKVTIFMGPQDEGTRAKFDKDVELKIFDVVAEEHRTRFHTSLGALFTLLAVIISAIISFSLAISLITITASSATGTSVSLVVPSSTTLIGLVVETAMGGVVYWVAYRRVEDYKIKQLPRLDDLLTDIREGKSLISIKNAIERTK